MRKKLKILPGVLGLLLISALAGCQPSPNRDVPDESQPISPTAPAKPSPQSSVPSPVLVQQDADRSVQLSSLTGVLHGDSLQLDPYDRIVGWKDRSQRVVWRMKLIVPGTYRLECDSTCTGPTREARLRVQVGDRQFVEEVAGLSEKPGMLAMLTLGEVTLDAPQVYEVELVMVGLPLVGEFSLAELRLVPVETKSSPLSKFATEQDAAEKP